MSLVCVNFYLERKIYQFVMNSDHPEHTHMELVGVYASVLRRFMVCVAVCVLLYVCVGYRDPLQQSLQVLQQLRETQRSLKEALQHAESLGKQQKTVKMRRREEEEEEEKEEEEKEQMEEEEEEEEEEMCSMLVPDLSHLSHRGWNTDSILSSTANSSAADITLQQYNPHNASAQSAHSPLVYSILVEDKKPRYSLRSRRSETR
ncbi:rho GTPase-activating protein gacO isoform X2 [Clinocottus analis]|uniref:rho GTPase-activating protein gacO isoform X2 n=1 Tax=Clinocottus analis TaxID=304258 RepID=UPI0035BEE23A